ncbi:MAG TPA: hypothetical protein VH681_14845 [Nitrospiraceae bacterium]|jgi:hypothetical protein
MSTPLVVFRQWLCVLSLVAGFVLCDRAVATTIYSYVDERGNAVMTDNYDTIPVQYRSKVKITESPSDRAAGTHIGELQRSISHSVRGLVQEVGGLAPNISGLSPHQSQILTWAGVIALICIAVMYLSRGQVTRFLALWFLVLVGIATPVLMYTSKGGPTDVFRTKAGEIQEKQQDRLKQAQ